MTGVSEESQRTCNLKYDGYSHNRSALRCYQSLGFHITATAPFGDQGLELTTMRLITSRA
ncbi:hypothetical protein E0I03_16015 [Dickeya dadantii]|uniref:hypothetical protein n=1 Tax=Dickeya dadantii TaxID=204038 RepID=UPI001495C15A|nr:hypothetical protein [Dickeya dadantii]NPE52524.1 hypothetical protein [Dickeya dadantii]